MDSYRFLPMRLADMPTTFGVSDVAKGFFPYRLNTPELWDKCIAKQEIEDFEPDFMSISKLSEFLEWYRSAIEEPYMQRLELVDAGQDILCTYDIFAENLKYCRDDERELRMCFLKFLEACMQTTGKLEPGPIILLCTRKSSHWPLLKKRCCCAKHMICKVRQHWYA